MSGLLFVDNNNACRSQLAEAFVFCDCSFSDCPVLPGKPALINWNLFKDTNQQETLESIRDLRDKI